MHIAKFTSAWSSSILSIIHVWRHFVSLLSVTCSLSALQQLSIASSNEDISIDWQFLAKKTHTCWSRDALHRRHSITAAAVVVGPLTGQTGPLLRLLGHSYGAGSPHTVHVLTGWDMLLGFELTHRELVIDILRSLFRLKLHVHVHVLVQLYMYIVLVRVGTSSSCCDVPLLCSCLK